MREELPCTGVKYIVPKAIREEVERRPGQTIRQVILSIKHHYSSDSSAVSTIHRRIEAGDVDGVELSSDYPVRLYPPGTAPGRQITASLVEVVS